MKQVNCVRSAAVGLICTALIRKDWTITCRGKDFNQFDMDSTVPVVGNPAFEGKPTGEFWMVAAGDGFCVAISREDRSLRQWGNTQDYGLMPSDPDDGNEASINAMPTTGRFVKVAANGLVALALDDAGHMHIWGWRASGYGNTAIFDDFEDVDDATVYTDIAVGRTHCLALTSAGHIVGWGGDVGNDYIVEPSHGSDPFIAIAAGDRFSLAMKSTATGTKLICIGALAPADYPDDPVDDAWQWTMIAAYLQNAMALRSDGTAAAWGNDVGWFRSATDQSVIPYGHNRDIKDIAVGYSSCTIVKHTGGALSWGENIHAILATWHNKCFKYCANFNSPGAPWSGGSVLIKTDGTVVFASALEPYIPMPIPRLYGNFIKASGGVWFTLCLKSNGNVVGVGLNTDGQCTPPSGVLFKDIAAGNSRAFGVTTAGLIRGWGNDAELIAIAEALSGPFDKISMTCLRTGVALKSTGQLVQFNTDSENDLGDNLPSGSDFVDVACGFENNAIALRSNGTVAVWGLDLGPEYNWLTLPPVNAGIIAIAAGDGFNVVLYNNGTIYVWGWVTMPYDLDALNGDTELNRDITKISMRSNVIVCIKKDMTAFAFGFDGYCALKVGI